MDKYVITTTRERIDAQKSFYSSVYWYLQMDRILPPKQETTHQYCWYLHTYKQLHMDILVTGYAISRPWTRGTTRWLPKKPTTTFQEDCQRLEDGAARCASHREYYYKCLSDLYRIRCTVQHTQYKIIVTHTHTHTHTQCKYTYTNNAIGMMVHKIQIPPRFIVHKSSMSPSKYYYTHTHISAKD